MIKDFSFNDIKKYLEKENADIDILDTFDKLADAAIIFMPLIFGPQFLPLLGLLDVKDRLVNLGKNIIEFIASRQKTDYISRAEQIKVAYALISFTAYFDALNRELPQDVRKKLELKFKENQRLVKKSTNASENQTVNKFDIHCEIPYTDHITSFADTLDLLKNKYVNITENIIKLIDDTEILADDQKRAKQLKNLLLKLPEKAVELYKAQCLHLVSTFNDFALYVQYEEFKTLHNANRLHIKAVKMLIEKTQSIDVGLQNLYSVVNSISTNYKQAQSQDIISDLKKAYQTLINQPIIDDKEITSTEESLSLSFPKIVDAFIPQSYKCLSYQQKGIPLEDEDNWKDYNVHHDLDKFFMRYLCSPDSIEFPLVILGHPGSGKSLLTKILSAQLMSESYTVIRIPLREVNADAEISLLVEEQIKKITNRILQGGYGEFAKQFSEKPIIIILDGYDELLQAKGNVFASYLEKVRLFQQNQKEFDRPARVIVTSRITLIDKAYVPVNSTILRLMEFNEEQRNTWINIWNKTNDKYFDSVSPKIKPFSLPSGERNSLIELSEQPLLLLMLALYDSEDNSLANLNNEIKRTELYDNLLQRFVRRERRRYVDGFDELPTQEQAKLIDTEMKRLGVVAIGMYNRRKLFIHSKELDSDLIFFESNREAGFLKDRTLKDSESLLGGFFFIHQSTAQDIAANVQHPDSAFEFLHNTFGEFLTADFILRFTVQEVKTICNYREGNDFTAELKRKLSAPDGFGKEWFACLMFTPLYSRPVVIEMIQEHITKSIRRKNISYDKFIENLCFIVKNQLNMILSTKQFPEVMLRDIDMARDIPLLGYLSIYTMNLIILVSVLCSEGFEFEEDEYKQIEIISSETKPWDKLSFLWRSWFSSEDLTGLSAILKASRKSENKILIRCNDKFEAALYNKQPIDVLLCISSTLADNLLTGLAGIQTQRFQDISKMNEKQIFSFLKKENQELYFSFMISVLRSEINDANINFKKINDLIGQMIKNEKIININHDIILSLFEIIECCINRNIIFLDLRHKLSGFLSEIIEFWMQRNKKPNQACICGFRLLRFLSINKDMAFVDERMMFDRPYFRRFIFDNDLNTYLFHNSPHDMIVKKDDSISLFNAMEFSPIFNYEKKVHILKKFVLPENMNVLIQTNPELITKVFLMLIKNDTIKVTVKEETIVDLLNKCFNEFNSMGIDTFGFNAFLNTLRIACHIGHTDYLKKTAEVLDHQLLNAHSRYFSYIFFNHPSFIAELIDLMPQLFTDNMNKFVELFFFGIDARYFNHEKLLDYIKLFRCIINSNIELHHDTIHNMNDLLSKFSRSILNYIKIGALNIENLTIEYSNHLKWLAEKTENKNISNYINSKSEKFLEQETKRKVR
jgi:adenylate kinase family enzyme